MSGRDRARLKEGAQRVKIHVAVDGPAGAGKSTVGGGLARALESQMLDTGLMYRELTRVVQEAGIDPDDAPAVADCARGLEFGLTGTGPDSKVWANNRELNAALLHTSSIDRDVSAVSAHAEVRPILVSRQRRLAEDRPIVMLGRDIGTVVLPDALVKIFLAAAREVREKRRYEERIRGERPPDEQELRREIVDRDRRDESREVSPMRKADDAMVIETDRLSIAESIETALAAVWTALDEQLGSISG